MTKYLFENFMNFKLPTHLPLATCGKWPSKWGEWLSFQIFQNCYVLKKIKILETWQNKDILVLIHTHTDESGPRMTMYLFENFMNFKLRQLRYYLSLIFIMWQMAKFIRHICGEQKKSLGHRWFKISYL